VLVLVLLLVSGNCPAVAPEVAVLLAFPEFVPAKTLLVLQVGPLLLRRRRRLLDKPVLWRGKGSVLRNVLVLCGFIINIFVVVVVVVVVFFLLLLLIRGRVPVVILVIGSRFRLVESRWSVDSFLPRERRKPEEEEEARKKNGSYILSVLL